jgi:hypothetical protein
VRISSLQSGLSVVRHALIDTGTQVTLFDDSVAFDLGLDLADAITDNISGLEGMLREARLASVELCLLDRAELSTSLEVGFAADLERTLGNLLRLDALEGFDFGLSHARRTGYLSRIT